MPLILIILFQILSYHFSVQLILVLPPPALILLLCWSPLSPHRSGFCPPVTSPVCPHRILFLPKLPAPAQRLPGRTIILIILFQILSYHFSGHLFPHHLEVSPYVLGLGQLRLAQLPGTRLPAPHLQLASPGQ